MKTFYVEKEVMRCAPVRYEVHSDGTEAGAEYESSEVYEICTGFTVCEQEEGHLLTFNEEFYPVQTDTAVFTDNSEQVLEQIKRDYPAPEWQNNNW